MADQPEELHGQLNKVLSGHSDCGHHDCNGQDCSHGDCCLVGICNDPGTCTNDYCVKKRSGGDGDDNSVENLGAVTGQMIATLKAVANAFSNIQTRSPQPTRETTAVTSTKRNRDLLDPQYGLASRVTIVTKQTNLLDAAIFLHNVKEIIDRDPNKIQQWIDGFAIAENKTTQIANVSKTAASAKDKLLVQTATTRDARIEWYHFAKELLKTVAREMESTTVADKIIEERRNLAKMKADETAWGLYDRISSQIMALKMAGFYVIYEKGDDPTPPPMTDNATENDIRRFFIEALPTEWRPVASAARENKAYVTVVAELIKSKQELDNQSPSKKPTITKPTLNMCAIESKEPETNTGSMPTQANDAVIAAITNLTSALQQTEQRFGRGRGRGRGRGQGPCFNCGQHGHVRRNCTNPPQQQTYGQPQQQAYAQPQQQPYAQQQAQQQPQQQQPTQQFTGNQNRRFCGGCKQTGHSRSFCTSANCVVCGVQGHAGAYCGKSFCQKCQAYGHMASVCNSQSQQDAATTANQNAGTQQPAQFQPAGVQQQAQIQPAAVQQPAPFPQNAPFRPAPNQQPAMPPGPPPGNPNQANLQPQQGTQMVPMGPPMRPNGRGGRGNYGR